MKVVNDSVPALVDTAAAQARPARMSARVISDYLRMIKFSHTIFALPFAGIAFLLALPGTGLIVDGSPTRALFILVAQVVVCMAALRSAAMGFNRIADRHIDARNPRTSAREIPRGIISVARGWWFVGVSLLIFFATAFTINLWCALLSPVAIALALGYSYSKRFTFLCHFLLGIAIGIAPTATWLAVRGHLGWPEFASLHPLLWSAGLAFYIAGFDILYACMDADFDRAEGLHSIPARFGVPRALWIARASHAVALTFFVLAGRDAGAGAGYFIAAVIVAFLFVTEHLLVRADNLKHVPVAFFHVNASISSVLFLGLLSDVILRATTA